MLGRLALAFAGLAGCAHPAPPPVTAVDIASVKAAPEVASPKILAEAIPHFDAEGRLSIAWRYEKPSDYASRDGQGLDYTVSAVIESNELPPELADYRDPPVAVRNYLANGGEPISGWSRVD